MRWPCRSLGGQEILDSPEGQAWAENYRERIAATSRPGFGPNALTRMLAFMNSEEFASFDLEAQWEALRLVDNEDGAFHRRLMH